MSIVNGGLWFVYGLTVGDAFIWVPNGIGACMGAFQAFLRLVFAPTPLPCAPLPPLPLCRTSAGSGDGSAGSDGNCGKDLQRL